MKTFKQYTEACWDRYVQKGMKKKGNRMVPNCVPEETVNEDGMGGAVAVPGPTNVTGVATSTDPISATAVNRKRKRNPILMSIRRKPPQG